jgi:nucleotide-binding universal stress UspA family protein
MRVTVEASTDRTSGRYRSILVSLDPYQPGSAVLDRAVAVALRDSARLTLLSVVPTPSAWAWSAPVLPYDPMSVCESDCERCLRAAASAVPQSLSVVSLVRRGSPTRALLAELRTGAHDLAVVGIPARRWISIARCNRTSWRVLRRSPVPVLVVTDTAPGPRAEARAFASPARAMS